MGREKQNKVAVGAFSIECNSFVRGETTLEDFRHQVFFIGQAISRDCAGPVAEFAGAWDVYLVANLCDSKKSLTNWGEFVMSLEPYEVRLSVSI